MSAHSNKKFSTPRNLRSRLTRINSDERYNAFHKQLADAIGSQNADMGLFLDSFMTAYSDLAPTLRQRVDGLVRNYVFYLTSDDISAYFAQGLMDALERRIASHNVDSFTEKEALVAQVEATDAVSQVEPESVTQEEAGTELLPDEFIESDFFDGEGDGEAYTFEQLFSMTNKQLLEVADEHGFNFTSSQKANKASIIEALSTDLMVIGLFADDLGDIADYID